LKGFVGCLLVLPANKHMATNLLIIIPCFNEEASLPALLRDLAALKLPERYEAEVVVVNDCSKDRTADIARQHQATLIDLPVNLGIGGAVQSGLIYAQNKNFDLAVQIDGDGQHPPAELIKLLNCHEQTAANLIIGSRFIDKEGFQSSFTRRLGIAYFHWLNRAFTGQNIVDSTSGFRLFDKRAIQLAASNYPDEFPEPESLVFFARNGLKVKETPVIMAHRQGGKSSIRNFVSLYYCIKVTLAMAFASIRKNK
jgi:glycosyltransferase involved in cell wall biosynthesis